MKRSNEIQLQLSEARQKANELSGKGDLNTEEKKDLDATMARMSTLETQYRASIHLENTEEAEQRSASDGESAERGKLETRALLGEYLSAAVESRAVEGAEKELNEATGLGTMNVVPWAAIAPREVESRADAAITAPTTGNPQSQDTILARVFERSATAYLNVSMPSVPVGTASYPVFETGTTASMANKAAAVDADAATFMSNVISPTRLSAAYLWSVEDTAATRDLEEALRQDLSMVMSDEMDKQVLTGNGTAPNVAGFFATSTGLDIENSTALAKYAEFRKLYVDNVDGRYANAASEIRAVVHPKLYAFADGAFRSNESEDTGLMAAQRIGGGFRVCAHMPDVASKKVKTIWHRGTARAAIAPIWAGVRLIRDEITQANKGRVRLTALALFGFKVIRKAQYGIKESQIEA